MLQGEIWEVYFNPTQGSEQSGKRPAVIVSGNLVNHYLQVVIVCPLTTSVKNYKGNVVLKPTDLNGLKAPSEILTFHIRSISKKRFSKKLGQISKPELEQIKSCLNDLLRY